jgi:hypothetical protein
MYKAAYMREREREEVVCGRDKARLVLPQCRTDKEKEEN